VSDSGDSIPNDDVLPDDIRPVVDLSATNRSDAEIQSADVSAARPSGVETNGYVEGYATAAYRSRPGGYVRGDRRRSPHPEERVRSLAPLLTSSPP
jgi:hypothetical protein